MTTTATGRAAATATASRAAGYAHAATWIIGLAVAWGATPEVGDTHDRIAAAYADRPVQAMAQALLVHGVAAVGLAVIGAELLGRARRTGNAAARFAGRSGTAAAALALVQLVLELIAVPGADPASPDRTGVLFEAVQRVDGVKMFALAALAAAVCVASARFTAAALGGRHRLGPRRHDHRVRYRLPVSVHRSDPGGVRVTAPAAGLDRRARRSTLPPALSPPALSPALRAGARIHVRVRATTTWNPSLRTQAGGRWPHREGRGRGRGVRSPAHAGVRRRRDRRPSRRSLLRLVHPTPTPTLRPRPRPRTPWYIDCSTRLAPLRMP